MAYARRASALILSRIMAIAEARVHQEIACSTNAAPGMPHMQRRWRRPTPGGPRRDTPDEPEDDMFEVTQMKLPDVATLQTEHPELYKLIAGHLSYANAPTNEAAAMATRELRERLTERLKELFPGRSTRHLLTRSSLMKLKLAELRAECETMGLSADGFKEALVGRLLTALDSVATVDSSSSTTTELVLGDHHMELPMLPEGSMYAHRVGCFGFPGIGIHTRPIDLRQLVQLRAGASSDEEDDDVWEDQMIFSDKHMKFGKKVIPKGRRRVQGTWDGVSDPAASMEEAQAAFAKVFSIQEVVDLLREARAGRIAILDVAGRCSWADTMVVATCRSRRHVHATGAAVMHEVKQRVREVAPGVKSALDGAPDSDWVVVDAGSMVVHLMTEEQRETLSLEALWTEGEPHRLRVLEPGASMPLTLDTITAE